MSSSEPRWLGGYHLQRRLGAGGAGTVWEATDEGGMRVALKILHPILAATEEGRQRLEREARLVNQIPGSGVAKVVDLETEATSPFVATELIEGPTLAQVIDQAPLTPSEAFHLAVQLEDLLHRVHGAGIVHRDLKPSNIIISEDGPILIDFGIAQGAADTRLTESGKVTGTPGFVSPELLSAANPTFEQWREGDWWAWSALLLNALTGQLPFGQGRTETVLQRVQRGEPELGGLPHQLTDVFHSALAADPNERPDPWGLIEQLSAARNAAAPPPPPPPPPLPQSGGTPAEPAPAAPAAARPLQTVGDPPSFEYAPSFDAGAAGVPPAYMAGAAELPPPPYAPQLSRPYPLALVVLAGTAALMPLWWGGAGLAAAAALLVLLGTLGAGHRWRENRRVKSGGPRRADSLASLAFSPRHLLVGLAGLLPGAAAGAALGSFGWYLFLLREGDPGRWAESLGAWLRTGHSGGPGLIVWALAAAALTVTLAVPTSAAARRGLWLAVDTVLPERGPRIAVYLLVTFAVASFLVALTLA